jgi:hypothetical protein
MMQMIRSVSTLGRMAALALVAIAAASCSSTTCGAGTKQVQAASGAVTCVAADVVASGNVPCDVDGGTAEIVDGVCVARTKCDPATTMTDPVTGECIGTGGAARCPVCPANVPPTQVCVQGDVIDFVTGTRLKTMSPIPTVRVAAYEPLSFLANPNDPNLTPLGQNATNAQGCYALTVPLPGTGLIAVGVNDPTTGTPAGQPALVWGAAGSPVTGGETLTIDIYRMQKSTADSWTASGINFAAQGAFVGCYYKDPGSPPGHLAANETMPLAGVQLLLDGAVPAGLKFLKADRTIDGTLTATGPLGCAVVNGDGMIHTAGGMGGGVAKFESLPGAAAPNVAFFDRFHDCDVTAAGSDPNCP